MAFTKIVSPGIDTTGSYTVQELNTVGVVTAATVQVGSATTVHTTGIDLGSGNITSHNINSTGIITATSFVGPVTGNITGDITAASGTFSGNVSIGGTLTYEDVTNIDAVGVLTARSDVSIADKIIHTDDIDTTIRFPAADTVTVETDGSERVRITSAGRVGIGTDLPDSMLHIKAGNDRSAITLENTFDNPNNVWELNPGISGLSNTGFCIRDVTDSANRFIIDGIGRVGIGTDNPGAILSLPAGESNTPRFAIESAVDDNDFTITQYEDGNGTYTMLGQNVKLNSSGNNTILDSGHRTAGILLDARNHGAITFLTGGTNAVTEPVKITSAGRFGIGTNNPQATLQIGAGFDSGNSQQHGTLLISADNSLHNYIRFTNGGATETHYPSGIWYQPSGRMELRTASSASASNEAQLVLASNGSIGINETSPNRRLYISGSESTAYSSTSGSNNAYLRLHNKNGTDNSGVNNQVGIEFFVADGATTVGMLSMERTGNNIGDFTYKTRTSASTYAEHLRITSGGDISISGDGTVHGVSKLTLLPANRTTAFSAGDGDTWHDVVLKQTGDATNNAVGIAFEVSADAYHKNAGTGIAAVKNGIDSDYGSDLVFITRGQSEASSEKVRIKADGDIVSGNITISGYTNTHNVGRYSVLLSDNHGNTFFGQNLRLDHSGGSGNHQLKVINQHSSIGGAGMLMGGNGSAYVNELNFYTVSGNTAAGTRVDNTNKRMTIRSNGDVTMRGTNSQYVEMATYEQTSASKDAIIANNTGYVVFNELSNTNTSIISHNPSSNANRITFPVAGAVHFSMYQDVKTTGNSGYLQARLYRNGSIYRYALLTLTNNQWDSIDMATTIEVNANDYIQVYYTGGDITAMDNSNWLSYNFMFFPINTNRS